MAAESKEPNSSAERMEQSIGRFSAAVERFAQQVERMGGEDRGTKPTEEKSREQREPRGGLLHGNDPNLASRVEEALHVSDE